MKLFPSGDRCASTSISPIKSGAFSFTRKQKKIPAALKEVNENQHFEFSSNFGEGNKPLGLLSSCCFSQVTANTENSSMSGYLNRSKGNKKPWKRLWFVIKDKVLYTYAASEVLGQRVFFCHFYETPWFLYLLVDTNFCLQDVAALESQPLLGFFLREEKNGPAQKLQFKLYHKNNLYYIFKADDIPTAQRYQEVMVLIT